MKKIIKKDEINVSIVPYQILPLKTVYKKENGYETDLVILAEQTSEMIQNLVNKIINENQKIEHLISEKKMKREETFETLNAIVKKLNATVASIPNC